MAARAFEERSRPRVVDARPLIRPVATLAESIDVVEDRAHGQQDEARTGSEGASRGFGRRSVSPREACFVFGLANRRPSDPARRRADNDLAALIGLAQPQDCLDAAFAGLSARPSDFVGAARSTGHVPPPFRDVDYFAAIARWLGCAFDRGPAVHDLVCGSTPSLTTSADGMVLRAERAGRTVFAIVPAASWLPVLGSLMARCPSAAARLLIVPPQAMSAVADDRAHVAHGRLEPLHQVPASALADRVVTRGQTAMFALLLLSLVTAVVAAPFAAMGVGVVAMTLVLVAYAASRALALAAPDASVPPRRRLKTTELPEYSILVPLYREDPGLKHLVQGLKRLDYPTDKLDIQFLVEADDAMTQRAVVREAVGLKSRMTIVPPGLPRTKPRALNVGLRQARGSLVTIFDAEDRPDPRQLRVAAETFAAAPPDLVAVQARLTIDHIGDNWLTKMFAIEYACLFDHIMPMVASSGRLVLLGGTSNHFRTDALIEAGGWDPYNVTEDADLAVRLRRCGHRIAMIDSQTFEEAPVSVDAWVKQRSRWFKGYIQTWLVHNRHPIALVREIGIADTLVFHLFVVGALVSALAHCIFVVQLLLVATGRFDLVFGAAAWLGGLQTLAVCVGYGTNFLLGAATVHRRRTEGISPWAVLWFPVYWVLMGVAVLIAVHDIIRKPHHWRKTAHGVAVRPRRPDFGATRAGMMPAK